MTPTLRNSLVDFLHRPPGRRGWLLCLAIIPADIVLDHVLRATLPSGRLLSYPAILDPIWLGFDTLFGIPLVAISEEVLARGAFLIVAERLGLARLWTVMLSSLLFAAFHWSLGWASIASAGLFGAAAMVTLLATRSLWPAIIAHWASDLALFSLPMWMLE